MRRRDAAVAAAMMLAMTQTPSLGATVPPQDQREFCALVARARAGAALPDAAARQRAVKAAGAEVESFVTQHRGIDWVGPVGRVILSSTGKMAGEIEACPSSWVGGLAPDGALDSDTWAEPETRIFDRWRAVKPGQNVEIRAGLLGAYVGDPGFPAKIWVRARIVDVTPTP